MRIYRQENVLEMAKRRIEWLFSEFDQVCVSWSGGKDSTVALHLTLEVAERLGRLPVPVIWIDQEAEWDSVVRLARQVMNDPRVEPLWLQVPIQLFNSTSHEDSWLQCWEPGAEWMREKEGVSIHENVYGTKTFKAMFPKICSHHFPGRLANIGGVRAEESPNRASGLSNQATYKWATWGKIENKALEQFAFYPLYDWTYSDIWKAIHDHGWPYADIYDKQYAAGLPITKMRVSNLHHESAVTSMLYMHEAEPETWARLQKRLKGVNAFRQLENDAMQVRTLPYMFEDWKEYREHLLDKLVTDPDQKARFRKAFDKNDTDLSVLTQRWQDRMHRTECNSILLNDWHMTKIIGALNGFNTPYVALRNIRRGNKVPRKEYERLREACPRLDEIEAEARRSDDSAGRSGASRDSRGLPACRPAD